MKFYMFEGSPEELSAVLPKFNVAASVSSAVQPADTRDAAVTDRFVTVEEAREVLTRRRLSDNILQMLRTLYGAGPRRLTTGELKKAVKLNADEFRGMVGAFGRRVKRTVPEGVWFWDQEWDSDHGENTWNLPEPVRQALRELKICS